MKLTFFQCPSLKTRVTLFTLVIFLISLWSLAFYSSRMLHQDMQQLLGERQLSAASFVATAINSELTERINGLETIAKTIDPALMDDAAGLQNKLERHVLLQTLFNAGLNIMDARGIVIADTPRSAGRLGISYLDRDYMQDVLRDGTSVISRPVMGRKQNAPIFVMAVPLRNAQGQVIGALSGVTNLGSPNFLDKVAQGQYGKSGGYVLAAPQHRLNVTASNKSRIMAELPAPGINPTMDRYAQGGEGTDVFINPLGVEVLASVKAVPVAGWYLAITTPSAEAFAPISTQQQRMMLAAIVLTLLAGALTWWMVRRQLAPLLSALHTLASRTEANLSAQPLPIAHQDEIGALIKGFNRLLGSLRQQGEALKANEEKLRAITDNVNAVLFLKDLQGRYLYVNRQFELLFHVSNATLQGQTDHAVFPAEIAQAFADNDQRVIRSGQQEEVEEQVLHDDGLHTYLSVKLPVRDANGTIYALCGVATDITERKRADADLRIAAAAFESQEAMMVTDAHNVILRVNQAFTDITGYTAKEAIGQTPRLLASGLHDPAFYSAMWQAIQHTGAWKGEVWDRRKNGEMYPKWLTISTVRNAAGTVTNYIGTHYDITERKKAEQKINELAFFDQLTGLPNRTLLRDRLHQAMTSGHRADTCSAVLFIDLDHFKTLNDTLGHDQGDLLLQQVAQRLSASVREGDTVARLGGDEFVVVLEGLHTSPAEAATQAKQVGEKMLAALNRPYQLGPHEHRSSASIGATLFSGHATSIDDLLKQADLAMYQGKETGRNALCFFDPAMQQVVMARAALEKNLRVAVRDHQFLLHYQAQVVADGRVTGAEVLVRWRHPERGMVSPAEFIPLAEETGLILPLGHWVLETACAQLAVWASQPALAHLTVAVNVSAQQFRNADFVAEVLAVLTETGANPQRLKLELTESLLVDNVQDIIGKMQALKARGVGFSLDDFGTGYSSLSYLKRLPLDQLKIDQSFVRDVLTDPNDAAIAKTVVALAHSLGLDVIAEGVETQAQRDFLANAGCHAYQGYFFSRPVPLAEFEVFMASSPCTTCASSY